MANPKSAKKSPATPHHTAVIETEADPEPGAEIEIGETTLTAAQKLHLTRVARFLVNVQSTKYSPRAAREGYRAKDHAEGWHLWTKAAGSDRPLDHWFSEQAQAAELGTMAADRLQLLRDIDTFENTWFPRLRALIRRIIPRDRRDAFAAAFFHNLAQEPLGPGVVGSVRTLLKRVEGLAASAEPGAKELFATLRQRGLTAARVTEMRTLLKQAEDGLERPSGKPSIRPEELAAAQAEQEAAFEDLKDWWNDWGTTLRPLFNAREQVVLALAKSSGRSTSSAAESGDDDDAADEDESARDEPASPPAAPRGK